MNHLGSLCQTFGGSRPLSEPGERGRRPARPERYRRRSMAQYLLLFVGRQATPDATDAQTVELIYARARFSTTWQ